MRAVVGAIAYPDLRPESVAGDDFVRFMQTAEAGPAYPPRG
jgi:hypothetical protein